ncbi:hypothetical protein HU755_10990 [Pseudomonas sp. SWRI111]|uniref:hypothetical protein n=1 Tax=Pseudomonas sp. SWRI111 TaxID=2745507 RepID=UPI001645DC91|nr:hypothetical protein [Pseudomonas sp. SWRI111]MBC3207314.1 hypothetical protein [Pseudomonas sp. SWRI111]
MESEYSTLVVGACILIVPEHEGQEVYSGLIEATLLAQLVANKQTENNRHINWYSAYVQVLDDFWLRQQKSRETWQINSTTAETALQLFTAALPRHAPLQQRVMATILAKIAQLPSDDAALQRLHSYMNKPAAAGSSDLPATMTPVRLLVICADSPTSITSVYAEFKTREALSPNPFQQIYQAGDIQGPVQVYHARANLSETRYGVARDAIARKVADRLAGSVAVLTLPKEITP